MPEERGGGHSDFTFSFTIDESGKLIYLSEKDNFPHINYPPLGDKEIYLRYNFLKDLNEVIQDDFVNSMRIIPPPALDEISTVHFKLMANRYCPEGVKFNISGSGNFEIVFMPSNWMGSVKEGDVYSDSFKILPTGGGYTRLKLSAIGRSRSEKLQYSQQSHLAGGEYRISYCIDESGKLIYFGYEENGTLERKYPYTGKGKWYDSKPKESEE